MSLKGTSKLIRAVLFDFDGTLTEPGSLDFTAIREAIGCPRGRPVLEYIRTLEQNDERVRASRILDGFEAEAARLSRPNEDAEETLEYLRARQVRFGIISRNSLAAIMTALSNFSHVRPSDFNIILSRDDPFSPKPSPEGILAAAAGMGVPVSEVLVVGDFVFDVEAGHKAGALTAFLTNRGSHSCGHPSDFILERLRDLERIIRLHAPLLPGKLPNCLLQEFLAETGIADADILLRPGIGEDVAAVSLAGEEILALKSDPITFATDAAAHYAVAVNINDIATSGAVPRWLTASLLFPAGANAAGIRETMRAMQAAALANHLILCGGHTEVTDAVTRPVIAAQVTGTVARIHLIQKRDMAETDRIVMTKALAVEGTSIIAREFPERLRALGMDEQAIGRCRNFLHDPGISILAEARIAAGTGKVSAMHDITEGGLATALQEFSVAGGHRMRIQANRIPIFPETREICLGLGISPLGLIGSGSLLITCAADFADNIASQLRAGGIEAVIIGDVLGEGSGIEAVDEHGHPCPWPEFETDELTRLSTVGGRET